MQERTIKMAYSKATKGTYVYSEVNEGLPPCIPSLYIQKWALDPNPPQEIHITLKE